jgi:hypothetical protein
MTACSTAPLLYDIDMPIGDNIGIRRNASFNSHRFIRTLYANMTIEKNRIVAPVQTDCFQIITQHAELPNAMIAKNEFGMRNDAAGPIIVMVYDAGLDTYRQAGLTRSNDPRYVAPTCDFYDNRFSVAYGGVILSDPYFTNVRIVDSKINQLISEAPALISPMPPQVVRPVFAFTNTPVNGQATIDAAEAHLDANPGSRPVVYLPKFADGSRRKTGRKTLVFPANKKMSLQGTGGLDWGGDLFDTTQPGKPLIVLRGPTKVTFDNFGVLAFQSGNKNGLHVVVDNCNQDGSRVYMEGSLGIYKWLGTHKLSSYLVNHNVSNFGDLTWPMEIVGDTGEAATGLVLFEAATGSVVTENPGEVPLFGVRDGGRLWVRDYWHETDQAGQIQFRLEGASQKGWLSAESSRFRPGDSGIFPRIKHWHDVRQITIDDWNGDMLLSAVSMEGRPTILGDTSHFRFLSFSSHCYAFDDGGYFYEFGGVPLKVLGTKFGAPGVAPEEQLPGWPAAYGGDDGDAYYSDVTGHLWVWKNDLWNDIGGIVGKVQGEVNLPGGYTGVVKDCLIVSDTNEVWQWGGAHWNNLADGSTPLPSVYWHYEGRGSDSAYLSQTWTPTGWYDSVPVGIGGTLPPDYKDLLDQMLAPAPPKFIDDLAPGVTDLRCIRFVGWIQFVPDVFDIPPDP